jgi:hypothetical protein
MGGVIQSWDQTIGGSDLLSVSANAPKVEDVAVAVLVAEDGEDGFERSGLVGAGERLGVQHRAGLVDLPHRGLLGRAVVSRRRRRDQRSGRRAGCRPARSRRG